MAQKLRNMQAGQRNWFLIKKKKKKRVKGGEKSRKNALFTFPLKNQ